MAADNTSPLLRTGDLIAQRYHLDRLHLDQSPDGAGTQWWEATDSLLGRSVLLKLQSWSDETDSGSAVDALRREARVASGLTVPGAIGVFDTGEYTHGEDPGGEDPALVAALVMEAPPGQSLRSVLTPGTGWSWANAEPLVESIGHVLSDAHRFDVIHGGLRPDLIWVDPQTAVTRIAGFGTTPDLSGDRYLAPELADNEGQIGSTVAGDIYALGAIAYELLSGHRPDPNPGESTRLHHRSNVAWPIADEIMTALSPEPADRPASIDAFLTNLSTATTTGTSSKRSTALARRVEEPSLRAPKKRRWWAWAAGLIIGANLVAGALYAAGVFGTSDPAASPVAAVENDVPAATPVPTAVPTPIPATPAPTATPEPTPTPTPPPTPSPTPVVVTISQAVPFDPPPGSGSERDELAALVFDGLTGTEWQTELYGSTSFGGLKTGVGLAVEFTEPVPLTSMAVTSTASNWVAQIYTAPVRVDTLAEWGEPVQTLAMDDAPTADGPGVTAVGFPDGTADAGAVLIWFTQLAQLDAGFGVTIDEISFNDAGLTNAPPGTEPAETGA